MFLTHNAAPAWTSLAWAGVLIGGSEARLGRLAAAYAHGLVDEPADELVVLVPHTRIVRDRGPWVFVRERPGARSPRTTGSPPRTLATETVLDLCETASPRELEDWVTRAVQRRLTTPKLLERALRGRTRHPHRTLLAELLLDVAEGAQSPLELRYLRDVERPHGLPRGRRQRPSPTRPAVRDVHYERYGVVVELDGRRGHEGESAFRDMARDNAALLDLLLTLRFGFGDVTGSPCEVGMQVGQVLRSRGWLGPFRRCGRCARTR